MARGVMDCCNGMWSALHNGSANLIVTTESWYMRVGGLNRKIEGKEGKRKKGNLKRSEEDEQRLRSRETTREVEGRVGDIEWSWGEGSWGCAFLPCRGTGAGPTLLFSPSNVKQNNYSLLASPSTAKSLSSKRENSGQQTAKTALKCLRLFPFSASVEGDKCAGCVGDGPQLNSWQRGPWEKTQRRLVSK